MLALRTRTRRRNDKTATMAAYFAAQLQQQQEAASHLPLKSDSMVEIGWKTAENQYHDPDRRTQS